MIYYSPHRKAHRRWRVPTCLCQTTVAVQFLLLLTVSLVVCGLLEMSDMGTSLLSSSGQKVMDLHDDPPASGGDEKPHNDEKEQENAHGRKYKYTYKTLTGYFQQDHLSTDAAKFNFMASNFGLIDRAYESDESLPNRGNGMTQWQRFQHHISTLNHDAREAETGKDRRSATTKRHDSSTPPTRYILFFLGRHGNGYHNIAERYYGNIAWDCHFSALDGDPESTMNWSDAHLSKEGQRQAKEVNSFWKSQVAQAGQKMGLPQLYLVSPLDRTLETAALSFEGFSPDSGTLAAIVMEKIREGTGIHTCDRRSNVEYIRQHFPSYNVDLDPNLSEEDHFWTAERREPEAALTQRLRSFFDDLFSNSDSNGNRILDPATERVSITSHSGAIGAMMGVLGHRQFSLGTGAVIPVFVKVARDSPDEDDKDKKLRARHGGSGEGNGQEDPTLDLPDLEHNDPNDKSKWETIPACPADMDLDTVGQKRWGMGLKEFLDGVENGTVRMEDVAFRFAG